VILDGAVTSCSAKGLRLQATGFSQKESEKEAARKRARKRPATSLSWALALAEACGLKPGLLWLKITLPDLAFGSWRI